MTQPDHIPYCLLVPATSVGEVLKEEFLKPLNLTADALADKCGLPVYVVSSLLSGHGTVTTEIARGLSLGTGTSPEFWRNLEAKHDSDVEFAIGNVLRQFAGRVATYDELNELRTAIATQAAVEPSAVGLSLYVREGRAEVLVKSGAKEWWAVVPSLYVVRVTNDGQAGKGIVGRAWDGIKTAFRLCGTTREAV